MKHNIEIKVNTTEWSSSELLQILEHVPSLKHISSTDTHKANVYVTYLDHVSDRGWMCTARVNALQNQYHVKLKLPTRALAREWVSDFGVVVLQQIELPRGMIGHLIAVLDTACRNLGKTEPSWLIDDIIARGPLNQELFGPSHGLRLSMSLTSRRNQPGQHGVLPARKSLNEFKRAADDICLDYMRQISHLKQELEAFRKEAEALTHYLQSEADAETLRYGEPAKPISLKGIHSGEGS